MFNIQTVTAKQLKAWMDDNEGVVHDLREPWEKEKADIGGQFFL